IGRPGRDHRGLPCEPGCCLCQDIALLAQLPVLTPQTGQLLALGAGRAVLSAAFVAIGLSHPVPDRLGGRFELARQLLRCSPRSDQINHLSPEFRRIRSVTLRHRWHLLLKWKGVHETGSTPEAICAPDNIEAALRAVVRNKGAPGIDGITVKQLPGILKARWSEIEDQLLQGRYQPQPVRRVRIPKPAGGTRNLGIPTVIDRVIQQAVLQRLQPRWDPTFSEHSYGFRPGRSAHQAVVQAQSYVIDGYRFVVDIDLAKFFDRVNHDRLLAAVAKRVSDRRVLRLVRGYLTAGVLDGGLFEESREGTPQGGPLSPLLSNLVLDELDRELEHRGHRFVRYADDCNIYVRSEKAGRRVMASLTRFIEGRLKLQINAEKSAVARPWHRSFLGFTVEVIR